MKSPSKDPAFEECNHHGRPSNQMRGEAFAEFSGFVTVLLLAKPANFVALFEYL